MVEERKEREEGMSGQRYEAVRAGEKEGKERLWNRGVMIVGREVRRRREKRARTTFTDVWITPSHSYDSWQAQLDHECRVFLWLDCSEKMSYCIKPISCSVSSYPDVVLLKWCLASDIIIFMKPKCDTFPSQDSSYIR